MQTDAEVAEKLTEDDRDVLLCLNTEWLRPMDVGGHDGSHHSRVLAKLARKGLADRARRDSIANMIGGSRGSYIYRLSAEGLRVAQHLKQENAK